MVPGMFHCRGGVGVDRIDALTPVIEWVEEGLAPDRIVARRMENGEVTLSRPLCPYPEVAHFEGENASAAESFRCGPPSAGDESRPSGDYGLVTK